MDKIYLSKLSYKKLNKLIIFYNLERESKKYFLKNNNIINREELEDLIYNAIKENEEENINNTSKSDNIILNYSGDLNKDYNIFDYDKNTLKILLKDREWAYVYWNISNKNKQIFINDDIKLFLRVEILLKENNFIDIDMDIKNDLTVFKKDISISLNDDSYYLYLPFQDRSYNVKIIIKKKRKEYCFLDSSILELDGDNILSLLNKEQSEIDILILSGIAKIKDSYIHEKLPIAKLENQYKDLTNFRL